MNNFLMRLRSATSLLSGKAKDDLTMTANGIEFAIRDLVRAMSYEDAEKALSQLNGLWARAKDQHLRYTKRPMTRAK